jgi:hypothetical protein
MGAGSSLPYRVGKDKPCPYNCADWGSLRS